MNVSRSLAGLTILLLVGSAAPAQQVTYDAQVLPIFRNQCLKCHNPDKAKADLDLSTYSGLMKGSSSGPIVVGGDPDGSMIIKVITHSGEPTMPPNSKLPDKDIDVIKKWVAGGLLENSGSKAIVSNRPKIDLSLNSAATGKPDGPPPMPGDLLLEPVVRTERTSASTALASSPWAPLVALGGQKQILLYHTETFEVAGVLPFPEGFPHDAKFSRNGRLLIVGGGRGANRGLATVWDITTGERILSAGEELDVALAADISSNQKWIALGGPDRLVKLYATSTGAQLHKMKKHTDWVTALEFNPASTMLATGDRAGGVVVWETETGQELQVLNGHRGAIVAIHWRSADVVITASEDGTVRTWNAKDGQQVRNTTAHTGGVLAASLLPDGRLATCGRDKTVATWDAGGNKQKTFTLTNDLPVRVTFTHDGKRVIATDWVGQVHVWDVDSGAALTGLSLNPPPIAERLQSLQHRLAELETSLPKLRIGLAEATTAAVKARTELDAAPKTSPALKQLTKQSEDAIKAQAAAKSSLDQAEAGSKLARVSVERLKLGQSFAQVYRAREDFNARKEEQQRLFTDAGSALAAIKQAEKDIAAARKEKPATREDKDKLAKRTRDLETSIKDNKKRAVASKAAADKMSKPLAAEQKKVETLASDYQRMKAGSAPVSTTVPPVPAKSAKLQPLTR